MKVFCSFSLTVILVLLLEGCSPDHEPTGLESLTGVSVEYYDIYGTTADELRSDLSSKYPVGRDGYRGDAATLWDIHWNWNGYGTQNCDLSTVKVEYSIRVILPRWVIPRHADSALVRSWNEYRESLVVHEKGHVINVIEQAGLIQNTIMSSQCENADSAAQAVIARIRLFDTVYDAETDHGATQGARFPRKAI